MEIKEIIDQLFAATNADEFKAAYAALRPIMMGKDGMFFPSDDGDDIAQYALVRYVRDMEHLPLLESMGEKKAYVALARSLCRHLCNTAYLPRTWPSPTHPFSGYREAWGDFYFFPVYGSPDLERAFALYQDAIKHGDGDTSKVKIKAVRAALYTGEYEEALSICKKTYNPNARHEAQLWIIKYEKENNISEWQEHYAALKAEAPSLRCIKRLRV